MTRHRLHLVGLVALVALWSQPVRGATTSFAAIGTANPSTFDAAGLRIGFVSKHAANPLFNQTKPWEPRLDNGYPNVVYNPNANDKANDKANANASPFQVWYGDCAKGCGEQLLLYANSSDGLVWEKPALGLVNLTALLPSLGDIGTANNVVMKGGGLGILYDTHSGGDGDYIIFGEGCFASGGVESCVSGTGLSSDGLVWSDAKNVDWPAPHRYDCHNNMFFDEGKGVYVATTRDGFSGDIGRAIGIATSEPGQGLVFNTTFAPPMVFHGDADHQLYSQITMPWHNIYLGLTMVFDATSEIGKVHCRLSYSKDLMSWDWVDAGGLTGADFVPLGSMGTPTCQSWSPLTVDGTQLSDCDAYRKGERPLHHICSAKRTSLEDMPLQACRDACCADPECNVMHWQGYEASNYSATAPGQCFVAAECGSVKPYSSRLAPTFCMETETPTRGPPGVNDFDSHVCFAAHSPVSVGDEEWIYYMGGNGPHSGARNSSFALATVRKDGFAGVWLGDASSAAGSFSTVPIMCAGKHLTVTVDVAVGGGAVSIGVAGVDGLGPQDAVPVTENVTQSVVAYNSGKNFSGFLGQELVLAVNGSSAMLYTFGWTD